MKKLVSTFQSRKFWFSIVVIGLAIGLFMTGHIDIDKMLEVVKWSASVYVGALSFEDAFKQLVGKLSSE